MNTGSNYEMCLFNKILCGIHIRHKGNLNKKLTVLLRNDWYTWKALGGMDSFLRSTQQRDEEGSSGL